ncbi:hypothetical protein Scep_010076 [Stephania cephalantha]|uniref:Uncharacterized protein n=1 Tax=Stephania cephalantha TaxID=152367 RepID=A0AAP0PGR1_9MAGN
MHRERPRKIGNKKKEIKKDRERKTGRKIERDTESSRKVSDLLFLLIVVVRVVVVGRHVRPWNARPPWPKGVRKKMAGVSPRPSTSDVRAPKLAEGERAAIGKRFRAGGGAVRERRPAAKCGVAVIAQGKAAGRAAVVARGGDGDIAIRRPSKDDGEIGRRARGAAKAADVVKR